MHQMWIYYCFVVYRIDSKYGYSVLWGSSVDPNLTVQYRPSGWGPYCLQIWLMILKNVGYKIKWEDFLQICPNILQSIRLQGWHEILSRCVYVSIMYFASRGDGYHVIFELFVVIV